MLSSLCLLSGLLSQNKKKEGFMWNYTEDKICTCMNFDHSKHSLLLLIFQLWQAIMMLIIVLYMMSGAGGNLQHEFGLVLDKVASN